MTTRRASLRALLAGITVFLTAAAAVPVNAQEQAAEATTKAPSAAEANNPLAKFQAFNVHNYYVPALSELDGQNANTFWLRYAQPFGKWLFRASLPASRVPMGDSKTMSGLGDFNAFAAYLFDTGDPAVSFGVGPQFTVPTASEDETGTGKWQGGFAATFFNAKSPTLQWGGLVTWQTDFAGDDEPIGNERPRGPALLLLPARGGLYVRGSAVAVFDLENDTYHVPVGLGIGKVVPTSGAVFNIFVEPQFTILDRGAGQPELQIFIGFNTQFVKK